MPSTPAHHGQARRSGRRHHDAWRDLPELPRPGARRRCPRRWILSVIAVATLSSLLVVLMLHLFSGR
ncbi:hypothetical protein KQ945_05240 [Bacillus subtilis subsp. subtilis]|nr:hypothetical protein [Bacillus subtilis subsp. subtilis]